MSIQTELAEIQGDKELITPEEVHTWATEHPDSEINKSLEWDNEKAGYQYRLWQIRRLIALHVSYEDGSRKLVSLSIDRTRKGGGYRNVDDVLASKNLYDIMLTDALKELERLEVKYEKIAALEPVWDAAGKVRRSRRRRIEGDEGEAKQA